MPLKRVTNTSFRQDVLLSSKPVLVHFAERQCAACHRIMPMLEHLSAAQNKLLVVLLDVEQNVMIADRENVMSVPTLKVYVRGKCVLERVGGFETEEDLREWVAAYF